tara:strand:- start:379 stop:849 length:471 start_codon:yes stop_codon:yes gene_type:complete
MKSLIIMAFLLISSNIYAQYYAYAEPNEIKANMVSRVQPNVQLEAYTTYLLISSMVEDVRFKYRKALRESKENPRVITIGTMSISSTELLKAFKKAARKADNSEEFTSVLFRKNRFLESHLTNGQIEELYISFRGTTFNGLLDELRLSYTSYQFER